MQAIYDAGWKLRKSVIYAGSPNLTKSVMRVPSGFNGGGFCRRERERRARLAVE